MAAKLIDLTGKRFGRLVVLNRDDDVVHHGGRKRAAWYCLCDCGTYKTALGESLKQRNTKSCGCLNEELKRKRAGRFSSGWKGGVIKDSSGYMKEKMRGHKNADGNGYVAQHVKVVSEFIGRPLLKHETVHHINGIRHDNRIENLELWSSSHPPGQRVEDKVAWAEEILRTYAPDKLKNKVRLRIIRGA